MTPEHILGTSNWKYLPSEHVHCSLFTVIVHLVHHVHCSLFTLHSSLLHAYHVHCSPCSSRCLASKRVENKSKPTSGSRLTLAYQTRGGGGPPRGVQEKIPQVQTHMRNGPQIEYSHTRPPSRSLSSCPSSKWGIGIASGRGARLRSGNNSHTLGQCERCPQLMVACTLRPHHTHKTPSTTTASCSNARARNFRVIA